MAPDKDEAPAKISEGKASEGKPNQETQEPSPAGGDQVAAKLQAEQEQGFVGNVPDETPNSEYTVQGVTKNQGK